jgi:hypothetical protein
VLERTRLRGEIMGGLDRLVDGAKARMKEEGKA